MPPDAPRVSIVVPAYNAEVDLGANLPLLRAEATEAEIIVVDDGSTDATANCAEPLADLVIRQVNRGPASARNAGAARARGEILVFVDADCRVTPGWRDALLAPLSNDAVVAVKGAYLTEQTAPVARLCQIEFEERYRLLTRRSNIDFVDSYSMAIRRSVFESVGGFDEAFRVADNEDVDLSFRVATRGHRMAFAPNARVVHRHPDRLGRYFKLKLSRGYHRMLVYERYPGKAVHDSYTPWSLKLQVAGLGLALASTPLPAAVALLSLPYAGSVALLPLLGLAMFLVPSAAFLLRTARAAPAALPLALPFLGARALAIGLGVLRRLVRLPAPRPKGNP